MELIVTAAWERATVSLDGGRTWMSTMEARKHGIMVTTDADLRRDMLAGQEAWSPVVIEAEVRGAWAPCDEAPRRTFRARTALGAGLCVPPGAGPRDGRWVLFTPAGPRPLAWRAWTMYMKRPCQRVTADRAMGRGGPER